MTSESLKVTPVKDPFAYSRRLLREMRERGEDEAMDRGAAGRRMAKAAREE